MRVPGDRPSHEQNGGRKARQIGANLRSDRERRPHRRSGSRSGQLRASGKAGAAARSRTVRAGGDPSTAPSRASSSSSASIRASHAWIWPCHVVTGQRLFQGEQMLVAPVALQAGRKGLLVRPAPTVYAALRRLVSAAWLMTLITVQPVGPLAVEYVTLATNLLRRPWVHQMQLRTPGSSTPLWNRHLPNPAPNQPLGYRLKIARERSELPHRPLEPRRIHRNVVLALAHVDPRTRAGLKPAPTSDVRFLQWARPRAATPLILHPPHAITCSLPSAQRAPMRILLVWCLTNTLTNLRVLLAVGCVALPRVVHAEGRRRSPLQQLPYL